MRMCDSQTVRQSNCNTVRLSDWNGGLEHETNAITRR